MNHQPSHTWKFKLSPIGDIIDSNDASVFIVFENWFQYRLWSGVDLFTLRALCDFNCVKGKVIYVFCSFSIFCKNFIIFYGRNLFWGFCLVRKKALIVYPACYQQYWLEISQNFPYFDLRKRKEERGKKRVTLSGRNDHETPIFICISRLYVILRSIEIGKNVLIIILIFSQFTPMYVPKSLSNASAQVLTQLRHYLCILSIVFKMVFLPHD